jgi:hypothetical protein
MFAGGPVEEAQVLLEDHIVKSQAMAASPFSKPFEDRLVPWEQKLQRFQVGGSSKEWGPKVQDKTPCHDAG